MSISMSLITSAAEWTLQQFREAIYYGHAYRFLIHDRDRICSQELDLDVRALGVRVLKTPFHSPQANSYCERLIGSFVVLNKMDPYVGNVWIF